MRPSNTNTRPLPAVGQTIVLRSKAGYASEGVRYEVTAVDRRSVHIADSTGAGTQIERYYFSRRGLTFDIVGS